MDGGNIIAADHADAARLARLDDEELEDEAVRRMLDAEARGRFPLDDPAFGRIVAESARREREG